MPSSDIIGWFADIGLSDRPTVGGKGGSLGELVRASIPVPPGFVVRTAAFERFLNALEKEDPIRPKVEALGADELEKIAALSEHVRARFESAPLPDDVNSEILAAHAELCGGDSDPPVAVRSSATTEDAADASFAGLQDTYLWVIGAHDTLERVRSCWASLYSVPSIAYRRKHGLPESGVAMAVVVQSMVNAHKAGVMFTRSPLTGDRSVITIEAAWGLGSTVVSGEVTPDRFVIAKITGEISVREISDKHVQHSPAPDWRRQRSGDAGSSSQSGLPERCRDFSAERHCAESRAPLQATAGYRVGNRSRRRNPAATESARNGLVLQGPCAGRQACG